MTGASGDTRAVGVYWAALAMRPTVAAVYTEVGMARLRQGQFDEAILARSSVMASSRAGLSTVNGAAALAIPFMHVVVTADNLTSSPSS
jgi:hypothetical protein